jgi:hypothetical protein
MRRRTARLRGALARRARERSSLKSTSSTLCGADSCVDFELFGRAKEDVLREFLVLEGGVPSHDTFSRLFRLLDPQAFAACLERLARELAAAFGKAGVVAIDGKGLAHGTRRNADRLAAGSRRRLRF